MNDAAMLLCCGIRGVKGSSLQLFAGGARISGMGAIDG